MIRCARKETSVRDMSFRRYTQFGSTGYQLRGSPAFFQKRHPQQRAFWSRKAAPPERGFLARLPYLKRLLLATPIPFLRFVPTPSRLISLRKRVELLCRGFGRVLLPLKLRHLDIFIFLRTEKINARAYISPSPLFPNS